MIIRRQCGENGKAPAMIALTANAMEGMREKFLDCGFQDFIAKPLDRRELGQLLARWVPEDRRQSGDGGEEGRPTLNPAAFPIVGIDMDTATRYYTGDEAGFVELLELYCMDGRRKTGLLRELVDSGLQDLSRYRTEVHGLKSAAANIGAMEVSNLARAQENASAQGDTAFILQQFPRLMEAQEALLDQIGQFLEGRRQNQSQEEKLPLSPQELRERVGAALGELQDFRSRECAGMVEALLRCALPQDAEDSLREIQGQLKLYEDDNAEALLGGLLSRLEKEEG